MLTGLRIGGQVSLGDELKWVCSQKGSLLTWWPAQPQRGPGDDGGGGPTCSHDLVLKARRALSDRTTLSSISTTHFACSPELVTQTL